MSISLGFNLLLLGMMGILVNSSHLFIILIMMEIMGLGLLCQIITMLNNQCLSTWIFLLFLFLMVCESSMGIGVLVSMARSHGSEKVTSSNLLLW